MSRQEFRRLLRSLQRLVWVQRAARILLRVGWLGLGGFLVFWALSRLLDVEFTPAQVLIGAVFLVLTGVVALIFPRPDLHELTWRLDRNLRLREQVSTAHQVDARGEDGPLARLLVEDAARLLKPAIKRVAKRGWHLQSDLVSALVVLVLFYLAVQVQAYVPGRQVPPQQQALLPSLGQDATAEEVFPSGIPGLDSKAQTGADSQQPGYSQEQMNEINQALSKMGQQLSESAATFDLGQALQQNNMEAASKALEQLAGEANALSKTTQENMTSALDQAAKEMSGTDIQPLSDHMQQAADNLNQGKTEGTTQAFDQLALDLRELSQGLAKQNVGETGAGDSGKGGSGASMGSTGSEQTGSSEPFNRLEGNEGNILTVVGGEGSSALVPSESSQPGGEQVTGSASAPQSQRLDFFNVFLTPYHYPWIWRDVVSKYFSR